MKNHQVWTYVLVALSAVLLTAAHSIWEAPPEVASIGLGGWPELRVF